MTHPSNRFAYAAPADLDRLVRAMPKAELHVHIEGAMEPEMLFALARKNNVALRHPNVESLRAAYDFENLQSFLDVYHASTTVLRSQEDFRAMGSSYLARARQDNVLHAEIFFDTQTYAAQGISCATVIDGLHQACSEAPLAHGMSASLILCFLRHLTEEQAFEALEAATPHLDKIVGVGLASAEMGNPPEKFKRVFAAAKRLGLRLVAHAGEEAPASYVWSALDDLKAERIDHGVRATEDKLLMERLARGRIPLTVCPLSNIKLKGYASLADHPLKALLEAGLMPTVNSDDPAYFGGHVNENFSQSFAALGMDAGHAYALAANSFNASFISLARRAQLLDKLNETFETLPLLDARPSPKP